MILGAILAGGVSRRFGRDKALADIGGRPMIDHVIAGIAPQVDAIVVCGREHRGSTSLADRPAQGLGPLAGLAAALVRAESAGFDQVVSVPCDTPGIAPALIGALIADGGPACIAACPVIGIWPARLAGDLEHFLTGPDRSMRAWAATAGARLLALEAPVNVNRPGDLRMLS